MINPNSGPGKYLPVQKTLAYESEKKGGVLFVIFIPYSYLVSKNYS